MEKKTFLKLIIGYLVTTVLSVVFFIISNKRGLFIVRGSESTREVSAFSDAISVGFFIFALLIFIFLIFLLIGIGIYVHRDAKKRGMNPILWTLIAIFVPYFIGLIIYLVVRKPEIKTCPECGKEIPPDLDLAFCPNCGYQLKLICPNCQKNVPNDVKFCPYCGSPLKGE